MLSARETVSADEPFDRLGRRSQRTNVKLRDVAKQVVDDAASAQKMPRSGFQCRKLRVVEFAAAPPA